LKVRLTSTSNKNSKIEAGQNFLVSLFFVTAAALLLKREGFARHFLPKRHFYAKREEINPKALPFSAPVAA